MKVLIMIRGVMTMSHFTVLLYTPEKRVCGEGGGGGHYISI